MTSDPPSEGGEQQEAPPPVPLEPMRERDPRALGDFQMLGRLGYGGMGVAYLAQGPQAWAVVKVVRSDLGDSSTFRARLARELEAMRRAEGPYTAALLDAELDGDPAWFAMEYIPGVNLSRRVADEGRMSAEGLTAFAAGLAEALAHVHAAGIVHRDLKPSNVMMSPTGPRLIDFGIAGIEEGTHLTTTGSVVGSTGWLAPEQVTGDPVTPATDVHAWALCVLFAATGEPPFGADSATASLYRVLEVAPSVPDWIPQPLRDLLVGALAKEPAYRPTLDQVSTALATGSTTGWTPVPSIARSQPAGSSAAATGSGRPRWLIPAAIGGGAMGVTALVLIAALGGSGDGGQASGASSPSVLPSAMPSAAVSSSPSAPNPTPTPTPTYAVKVEYQGDAIPDEEFSGTLDWTFDVCSPDASLLAAQSAAGVRLYAREGGKWTRMPGEATAVKGGGRCDDNQVNLVVPHREDVPAEVGDQWSSCRKYRVVIPETARFRKSYVDMCVRTRATT